MRLIATTLLATGFLVLSASLDQSRAGDTDQPAEDAEPLPRVPGAAARAGVAAIGERHTSALGKPCLGFEAYSRAHAVNREIVDYVVSIRNSCPKSIKVRICPKDSLDCNHVTVRSYQRREVVMGFGPPTDRFNYTAKEDP